MVKYTCPTCQKTFDRKFNYDRHFNLKKSICEPKPPKTPNLPQNPPETPPIPPNFHQEINNDSDSEIDNDSPAYKNDKNDKDNNLDTQQVTHSCTYCGLIFTRKDHMKRHMDSRCKVKKLDNEHKERTFELLIKENQDIKNKLDQLQKQIEKQMETQLNKVHTQNINKGNINKGNITNNNTNIIIPQAMLTDFGKEDYEKINIKRLLNTVKNSGVEGIISCFNDIHYNDETPQYKNVFITDKSRDKGMIWEGGQWKVKPIKKIVGELITHIERYHRVIEKRVRKGIYKDMIDPEDPTKKNKINIKDLKKNFESRLKKYILRYYGDDPDSTPQDSKKFYEMVLKHMSNHLFDIKDRVYSNYEKVLEDISKEPEDSDPEIKEIKQEKKQIIKELDKLKDEIINKKNKAKLEQQEQQDKENNEEEEDSESNNSDNSDDSNNSDDSDDSDNLDDSDGDSDSDKKSANKNVKSTEQTEPPVYVYDWITLPSGLRVQRWIEKGKDYYDNFD